MSLGGVHGADLAGLEELHDSIALVRLPSGCTRERTERLFGSSHLTGHRFKILL